MRQTYSLRLPGRLPRPLAALGLLLATAGAAQAQTAATFQPATTYGTGGINPFGIAVADVNGDGKPDLLTANQSSNTAGVLLGTGTGTFQPATTYGTGGNNPFGIAVADVNGDGKPDLLTANYNSNTAGVLLNTTAFAPTLATISPTSGPAGTSVTLTGSNLSGATAVTFAGTSNNTVTTGLTVGGTGSSQTLTVAVPTGATTGNVTVTTPGGTSNGVAFTVTAVAPVLASIETSALRYVPNQGATQLTSTLTVRDTDSPNLSGATVAISSGFVANDGLIFVNQTGITGSYNTGTGVLTLVGTASVATYQAALRSIQFGSFGTPITTPGDRVVRFTVSDGLNLSNALTRTVQVVAAPAVTTAAPSNLTTTSAVLGGTVTAEGNAAVTDRGVVYSSTNQTPTIGGAGSTQDANSTGASSFSETITSLAPGTTYYVRAYATNSVGTSYGAVVSFTTLAAPTTVASINRVGSSPTNTGSVSYTVTFAAAVTGLSTSNFSLVPTGSVAGASIASVSGAGTTYTVTVNTGTGDGTLGLNLANANGISPGLTTTLPFMGQVYTIDKTAPTVTISSPTAPSGSYTTTAPITFSVTFSEPVTGYTASDASAGLSNSSSLTFSALNASTYTVSVTPLRPGPLTFTVLANAANDAAGNGNAGAQTYTVYYNVTPPPLLITPSGTFSNLPTYSGFALAGSTVTFYLATGGGAAQAIGTTVSNLADDTFFFTPTTALAAGTYTVYATAQAPGQVVSMASNINTFTVPAPPTLTLLSPASGLVGTQVTITGSDLTRASAVSFNGTTATTFAVVNATTVTATVPAGATTGPVTVTALGGTSNGLTFTVTSVPVLANIEPGALRYVPGQAATQLTSTLTVSDADSPNLTGATVAFSSGFVAGDGLLFVNQNGISGSYNTGTGVLTMVGTASVAAYQAALRSIQFGSYGTPITTLGDRVVRFTVSDGTTTSSAVTRTVQVVATTPTVTTATPTNITSTSAVLGVAVSNNGGATGGYTYGIVYVQGTGTPTLSNTIGGAPSTYNGGNNASTLYGSVSGLTPGTTYTVRAYATNSVGTSYGSVVSFATAAPVSGTTVVTNVSCNGGSNGAINLTPSGGVAPYTYRWSTGATTQDITGLTAGAYSVFITDAAGATGTVINIVVTQPSALTATTSQTDVTTNGGTDGSATIRVGGGTPGYTYSWSPNVSTTATAANLSAGTYAVTATDANGCTITRTFTISQPAATTTVVSFARLSRSPTNTAQVAYQVVFGASVSGLSPSNFTVTQAGVSGASVSSVSGSGTTYTVVVNTGIGDGTLTLNLTNATGLSPSVSNVPFAGQAYTIDKTAPTLVITSAAAPDGGYTTTSPIVFLLTFSEPVTTPNIALTNAFTGTYNPISASVYSISAVPISPGAVTLTLPAYQAPDRAGNYPPVTSYTVYYNVPTAAPVLTAPANSSTSTTTTPTYSGTAPAGSTVTVFVNGTSVGTTTATGGTFSLTQPTALAPGQYTVYATAQLSGQAVSASSNTNTFTVALAPTVTLLSPATGPVGTSVTITGTNLSGATAVRFNGTAASSFVVNSATSITAIVAAGTTTGLVTVTTPGGTATSATPFVVRVAPTTVADAYSTPQGVTLTGNVLTNDIGTNPRAILINRPANGSLVLNPDGSFTYRPNASFTGLDTFTYYACDPNMPLLCGNPVTVSITVLRIAPVTVADNYTTPAGVTLTGNVLTNDLGTNPRAILINRPTNGSLVLNPDGSFSYTPNAGFVGTDTFTYYACDPNMPLLCGNPATVTITVTRVAPITVADAYSTPAGVTLTGNVLTNDIGTNPRAILINRPTRGTLVLNPDGSFSYRPTAGFSGLDTFTYYACNQGTPLTCGDPATVSITVLPVADTRVAAAQPGAPGASATAARGADDATGATVRLELALTGSPNPFTEQLHLRFALPIAQAYSLALYDAQGRLVQQLANGQAQAGQAQEVEVPTQAYATGLYLVRLTTATGTQVLKLLKQ